MPVIKVCFTNKKMGKMCMYVFMNSTYSPFLTAVIHRNQWKSQLNKKKTSSCLFLPIKAILVSGMLVLVSKLKSL